MNTFIHHMKSTRNLRKMITNKQFIVNIKFPFKDPSYWGIETYREKAIENISKTSFFQNYGFDLPAVDASKEAISFFESYGYKITNCEYFYFNPNYAMCIHIDGDYLTNNAKFNWAFGEDHQFKFFEPIEQGRLDTEIKQDNTLKSVLPSDEPYGLVYEENQVIEKMNKPIAYPSLCRVGHPHQLINGNKPLELFNIVITKQDSKNNDPKTKGWADMDELLEVFKEYVY